MDNEDATTFCQSDLPCTLFAAFEDMRKSGQFCDLTIRVQNRLFTAHRLVLAAGIPYFQSVFTCNEVETAEKEIAVEDLDPNALESLIHFVYTGKVIISLENVRSLLIASQFLQLNQVQNACVEFLSKRLQLNTVTETRAFAFGLNISELIESCTLFIRKNFEEFSKCEDFLSLPCSYVKEIIDDDELNVASEEIVFEAAINWVKKSSSHRQSVLPELLCEVRMIYLPVDYLIERVEAEELIRTSTQCRDLVNEVKNYHVMPKNRAAFSHLKMLPRNHFETLYTTCACLNCGVSVHRFDLVSRMWNNLTYKKVQFEDFHAAVAVNGTIYMFLDAEIQTFDTETRNWQVFEANHKGISGAAIVSHADRIYCFGSKVQAMANKIRCFDTRMNGWLLNANMALMYSYAAAASLEEYIYMTGNYYKRKYSCTVEKFNPTMDSWKSCASMLTSRGHHGCTSINGKIYVCGGTTDGDATLNTAEMYDPVTDKWSAISPMTNKICVSILVPHENRIYAFQEASGEIYDPKSDEWKCCLSVPGGFKGAMTIPRAITRNDST